MVAKRCRQHQKLGERLRAPSPYSLQSACGPDGTVTPDLWPPELGEYGCIVLSHIVCSIWLWQPQKTNTTSLFIICHSLLVLSLSPGFR